MTDKEKYRQLCENEKSINIFSTDWWMDAVCGENNWDVLLVEKNNQIVGALPYFIKKNFVFEEITQPPLTQTNGVWILYPENQKSSKKLAYEKEIMWDLIEKLESLNIHNYYQHFHYSITNWLPFYWRKFRQTTRYTYVIENLEDLDEVFQNFDHSKRKNIKKAEKLVTIKYDLSAEEFYENHKLTLAKQKSNIVYSFEVFQRIYNSVYKNNAGRVFYAVDELNNIHAAILVIWDGNSAYDLISTIDPDFRNSGAASLVVKEAITYVSDKTKKFDFEGSMVENIENSFRQFGATQRPYFAISKNYSRIFNIYNTGKAYLNYIRYRQ